MANSGSGADDDSFFSTTGGGTTMPASSGAEYRNSSTQASNSNFNSSGDRSSKNTSHHQQPSREGGRRDRHNNNDDPSSLSAPESPKLEGQHRTNSRSHTQNSHHQNPHHDHLSQYGGRDIRDGGIGDPYQLHASMSENSNAEELVASNNERLTQRYSNTHRLSTNNNCGGIGVAGSHQFNNNNQIMPSTTSSSTGGLMNNSSAASNSGSNTNVLSPSPPTSLSGGIPTIPPGTGGNAVAGEDSDYSDFGQQQPSTSNSRSRQKKFLKNFKQLPQEEVVLQRYSCALVSDILLQGHLYLTENYFAFYSNVFGYVTKLQIPIRSVTIVTKEKTAKIIPNAIGLMTLEHEKHVFSSFISRDTTFKLMTRLWKKAMRDLPQEELIVDPQAAIALENALHVNELDGDEELIEDLPDDISSDSDEGGEPRIAVSIPTPRAGISSCSQTSPPISPMTNSPKDIMEASYLVKRMSQSNGTIFYQKRGALGPTTRGLKRSPTGDFQSPMEINATNNGRRLSVSSNSTGTKNGNGNLLSQLTKSTIVSIFVIVLLSFLFCSSLYLVFRIDSLQKQVESQGQHIINTPSKDVGGMFHTQAWNDIVSAEQSEKMQKVLDTSVDQIAGVRKSLEGLASLVRDDNKKDEET